uniref:MFS domain-containing protein n=1 Tax=Panagrellus redivivus TaxID=6233 RepID=A0A7E4VD26_PANRE
MPQNTLLRLWQIALPLGLYSATSAVFFPVSQSFVFWKICTHSTDITAIPVSACTNRSIVSSDVYLQTEANRIFMLGNIAMTLTAVFSATFLGKLGDEKSRKAALAIPLVGLLLADAVLIAMTAIPAMPAILYVLSETIFGLAGGYVSIMSSCFAFGSHLSKTQNVDRSKAMAVLEGAIGVGGILGFLATTFIRKSEYLLAYALMAFVHVVCLILVLILTDIKPEPVESSISTKTAKLPFATRIKDKFVAWIPLFDSNAPKNKIILLVSCFGCSFFAMIGSVQIIFYYLKHRFHWDLTLFSFLKAPHQFMSTATILFLFPYLKSSGTSDTTLALIGLLSRFFGHLWLIFAWNTYSVYLWVILDGFSRFSPTAIRSLLAHSVESDQQGRIFSLVSVVELFCSLLAALIFHTLFPASIEFGFPQTSFVIMAAVLLFPIGVFVFGRQYIGGKVDIQETKTQDEAIPLNEVKTGSSSE